ncbi:MAG: S9 family peptidase, partial [Actinomycetota bacterium]
MSSETATELPYGSWPSPISAELVAAGGIGVAGPAVHGDTVWWSELRPSEGGRSVLVSAEPGGDPVDRLPQPWSARTRVHEYGGGAWWLGVEHVYLAEWSDQRLHRLRLDDPAAKPEPVTPEPTVAHGWRYADGREHPDGSWLALVREDHHGVGAEGGRTEAANEIVAIGLGGDPATADATVLVSGPDFVAAPRFSPDGRWLSWIEWDHPSMPWDSTRLVAAPVFANHRLGNQVVVAGGGAGESIVGADWTTNGRLVYSSDRNGWWNLHAWHPEGAEERIITALDTAEIGGPGWVFGVQRWTELSDGRLAVAVTEAAVDHLAIVELPAAGGPPAQPRRLPIADLTEIGGLAATADGRVAIVGAGPRSLSAVRVVDPDDATVSTVRPPDDTGVEPSWFSVGQAITFGSGPIDGPPEAKTRQANAFFYPPAAPGIGGPAGTAPPLVVMGHGGPTAHSDPALSLKVQYWTSRGFAVVDVNSGGSSGFGRAT